MSSIKSSRFFYIAPLFSLFLFSCDLSSTTEYEPITVQGLVTDTSNQPLEDAIVRIVSPSPEIVTTTNVDGSYTFTIDVDTTITFVVDARIEGFNSAEQEFLAIPERDITLPAFRLPRIDEGNGEDPVDPSEPNDSEGSAFITLESLTLENINVREAGGVETTNFEFIVTDSTGNAISDLNSVYVHFDILSGTDGGGESIYPDSVQTENGIAKAALTSGTVAGVVQIQASFTRNEVTESSKPVSVTISGGLPSENHFETSSEFKNIPIGASQTNTISALLGDRYGNTVKSGTAVYFSTSKGVIDGSSSTGDDGIATSILKTMNASPGIATVTMETVDHNSNKLNREIDVLFTGSPQLSINPETIDLENFSSQTFNLTLEDENGNPMAGGTTINVEIDSVGLELSGATDIELKDTNQTGFGYTEFEFQLLNPSGEPIYEDVNMIITVDGPNGSTEKRLRFEAPEAPIAVPGSIYLESVSTNEIGVRETGQSEDTQLTFQVRDINGNPITSQNAADVNFIFGDQPNGGEFLSAESITTNALGQATVTLTSGTIAGTVQVIAEVETENGNTIRSQPVAVVIHAGLPDQNHFSIKVDGDGEDNRRNVSFNDPNDIVEITAYAGDKYGNEVPDGTAIYFTTDGGFIYGSALTENGRATTRLNISNPLPTGGIATITASTADDNQQPVTANTQIIFSLDPIIEISPDPFDINNAEDQTFTYTVMDSNGNPMAFGTTITVTAEGDDTTVIGQIEETIGNSNMSNTQDLTEFRFNIKDAEPATDDDTPLIITIEVDGSNGSASKTIEGRKAKTF